MAMFVQCCENRGQCMEETWYLVEDNFILHNNTSILRHFHGGCITHRLKNVYVSKPVSSLHSVNFLMRPGLQRPSGGSPGSSQGVFW